jgi:hypothetical protein
MTEETDGAEEKDRNEKRVLGMLVRRGVHAREYRAAHRDLRCGWGTGQVLGGDEKAEFRLPGAWRITGAGGMPEWR